MRQIKWWAAKQRLLLLAAVLSIVSQVGMTQTKSIPFASVWRLDGQISVRAPDGSARDLKLGDTVFEGERLLAAPQGEAVLKSADGSYLAIRPNTELRLQKYVAERTSAAASVVELNKGALRMLSGWIGKINPGGVKVATPTATIGIRGTDHEPYVLAADAPDLKKYKPGTYDKVNAGATTLTAAGQSLDIAAGQVGFARSPDKKRALMTLLFPVLLERVPDFYVPGKFDAELDALAQKTESDVAAASSDAGRPQACDADLIGKTWLDQLDGLIVERNAPGIIAMFDPGIEVVASVKDGSGNYTRLELSAEDVATSTVDAVANLTEYKHRRVAVQSRVQGDGCQRILVESVAIEQGKQSGRFYRFESEEKFELELKADKWLAVRGETRQR